MNITIALYFDGLEWCIAKAISSEHHSTFDKYEHNEHNIHQLIKIIKHEFKNYSETECRIILVISPPESDRIFPYLAKEFNYIQVAHPVRLDLHTKRLKKNFNNYAELAALAGSTSFQIDELLIESTNICTFNCLFCTQDQISRPKQQIPLETAKRIITEYATSSLGGLGFHVMGEPTTNPDLPELIELAAKLHIDHTLVTNATVLTKDKAAELFEKGLMRIQISAQTFTKEQFYKFKRPLAKYTYEHVLENTKNIILAKWEKAPNAIMQIHVMDNSLYQPRGVKVITNNEEANEVLKFWITLIKELAIKHDKKEILSYITDKNTLELAKSSWPQGVCRIEPNILLTFKMAGHWTQNFLEEDELIIPARKGICKQITAGQAKQLAILSNGDAVMCCFDYDGGTKIGNINDTTFTEIDKKAIKTRQTLLELNGIPFETCRRCLGIRIKKLTRSQELNEENGVVKLKEIAIYGTSPEAKKTLHLFQQHGIPVLISIDGLDNISKIPDTIEAIIFPATLPPTQKELSTLSTTFPNTMIAQVELVALNTFARDAITQYKAKHQQSTINKTPAENKSGMTAMANTIKKIFKL